MMAWRFGAAAGLIVLLSLVPITAGAATRLDCRRPTTASERQICATPELRATAAAIDQLYATVRQAARPNLRAPLQEGQRRWLAALDRGCARAACWSQRLIERRAILASLEARVSEANPVLFDLDSVWLEGEWRVASRLPPGLEPASALPPPGTVSFRPGEQCRGDRCVAFGLEPQRLDAGPGRSALAGQLGLPGTTPFVLTYVGGAASYGLVPGPNGEMLAVTPGCAPSGSECRFMTQVWTPVTPDAALHRARAGDAPLSPGRSSVAH
ncbi:MAG: hypothetical protein NVSMB18_14240 [Acetobacteraceae bacterium]